jgi:hypothetical protein
MKTKQSIQFFISALLLICVFNFAKGQSLLLPVPGSSSPTGPTGYIDFTDPGNPQFVEFPFHTFFNGVNPGNPHSEEDLFYTTRYNRVPALMETNALSP